MKLYTEEQVLQIIGNLNREYFVTPEELLEEMKYTTIELPSNEEIDEKAFQVPYDNTKDFYDLQFIKGAKWMRDKIQGGNK
jgi:hypothetical protein